jgi:hypothetical protein
MPLLLLVLLLHSLSKEGAEGSTEAEEGGRVREGGGE